MCTLFVVFSLGKLCCTDMTVTTSGCGCVNDCQFSVKKVNGLKPCSCAESFKLWPIKWFLSILHAHSSLDLTVITDSVALLTQPPEPQARNNLTEHDKLVFIFIPGHQQFYISYVPTCQMYMYNMHLVPLNKTAVLIEIIKINLCGWARETINGRCPCDEGTTTPIYSWKNFEVTL